MPRNSPSKSRREALEDHHGRTDAERLTRLEDGLGDLQESVSTMATSVQRLAEARQWNWPTVFGGVGAIIGLIALASTYFTGPVNQKVVAIDSHLESSDASLDRLRVSNGTLMGQVQTMRADIDQRLVEVETQICAEDIIRNLMHANDLRAYSALYQKVNGVPYPVSNAYYPEICQRHPQSAGSP